MAMSEQYLRTKQAMLLAKKKEKEMNVANSIANLREAEVQKMREKVLTENSSLHLWWIFMKLDRYTKITQAFHMAAPRLIRNQIRLL